MNLIEIIISFTVGTKKKYYLVLLINFSNCMCNVRLVIPSDKMYFFFEHLTSISFEYSLDFCLYCNRFFLNNEVMPNGLNNDNYRLSLES